MWKTFALPRMLYGLEVFNLTHSDTMQLKNHYKEVPYEDCNTANVAVYCLLGARPVEQEINFRKLSLLASFTVTTLLSPSLRADKWLSKIMTAIFVNFFHSRLGG